MSKEKSTKTGLYGLAAKIGGKLLAVLPKFMKGIKLLKFGLLALSLGSYAYLWTWKFAVLVVVAILEHEYSHILAMKQMGMKTKGVFMIPLLGAVAVSESSAKTYGQWAYVAIAGPIGGLALTVAACVAYYITGIPMIAGAAGFIAFINVFNLFPISMLDGNQVLRSIAFSINKNLGFIFMIVSLLITMVFMFKFHAGLFAFLIIVGGVDLVIEFYRRKNMKNQRDFYLKTADEEEKWITTNYYNDFKDDPGMVNEYKGFATFKGYCDHKGSKARKKYTKKANDIMTAGPTPMNTKQIAYAIAAYALTTLALIVIIRLMAHVPGADLAATFLAS